MLLVFVCAYTAIPVLVYAAARLLPKATPQLKLAAVVVFLLNATVLGSAYHIRNAYLYLAGPQFERNLQLILFTYGWSLVMALPVIFQAKTIQNDPSRAGTASTFFFLFHALTLPATLMLWLVLSFE